jgi:hypothetical protein
MAGKERKSGLIFRTSDYPVILTGNPVTLLPNPS